jgi:hypothetical protein
MLHRAERDGYFPMADRFRHRPSSRPFAAALLAILPWLLLAGCRTSDQVRALEEENFQLCERITELEVELSQKDMQLDRLLGRSGGVQFEESTYVDQIPEPARQKPRSALPRTQSTSPGDLKPPSVELGTPEERPGPAPQSSAPRSRPARTVNGAPARLRSSGPVASVEVDSVLSGGLDDDGRAGDEGVTLVLRAYDAGRRAMVPSAEVDIALWDEVLLERHQGDPVARDAARVAVWKFEPQATAASVEQDDSGEPLLRFRLAWPHGRPQHDKLRVYVRMTCADGRKLLVDAPLSVSLSGRTAVRRDRSALTSNSRSPAVSRPSSLPLPADGGTRANADAESSGGREELSTADGRGRPQPKRPVWKPYR